MQKIFTLFLLLISLGAFAQHKTVTLKTFDGSVKLYFKDSSYTRCLVLERPGRAPVWVPDRRLGWQTSLDTAFWKEVPMSPRELVIVVGISCNCDTQVGVNAAVFFFSNEETLYKSNRLTADPRYDFAVSGRLNYWRSNWVRDSIFNDLKVLKYNMGVYDQSMRFFLNGTQLHYVNWKNPNLVIDTIPWWNGDAQIDTVFYEDMNGDYRDELVVVLDMYPEQDTAIPHFEVLFYRDTFSLDAGMGFIPMREISFELWPGQLPIDSSPKAPLLAEIEKRKRKK